MSPFFWSAFEAPIGHCLYAGLGVAEVFQCQNRILAAHEAERLFQATEQSSPIGSKGFREGRWVNISGDLWGNDG